MICDIIPQNKNNCDLWHFDMPNVANIMIMLVILTPEYGCEDNLYYGEESSQFWESVQVELLHIAKHVHVQPHRSDKTKTTMCESVKFKCENLKIKLKQRQCSKFRISPEKKIYGGRNTHWIGFGENHIQGCQRHCQPCGWKFNFKINKLIRFRTTIIETYSQW